MLAASKARNCYCHQLFVPFLKVISFFSVNLQCAVLVSSRFYYRSKDFSKLSHFFCQITFCKSRIQSFNKFSLKKCLPIIFVDGQKWKKKLSRNEDAPFFLSSYSSTIIHLTNFTLHKISFFNNKKYIVFFFCQILMCSSRIQVFNKFYFRF